MAKKKATKPVKNETGLKIHQEEPVTPPEPPALGPVTSPPVVTLPPVVTPSEVTPPEPPAPEPAPKYYSASPYERALVKLGRDPSTLTAKDLGPPGPQGAVMLPAVLSTDRRPMVAGSYRIEVLPEVRELFPARSAEESFSLRRQILTNGFQYAPLIAEWTPPHADSQGQCVYTILDKIEEWEMLGYLFKDGIKLTDSGQPLVTDFPFRRTTLAIPFDAPMDVRLHEATKLAIFSRCSSPEDSKQTWQQAAMGYLRRDWSLRKAGMPEGKIIFRSSPLIHDELGIEPGTIKIAYRKLIEMGEENGGLPKNTHWEGKIRDNDLPHIMEAGGSKLEQSMAINPPSLEQRLLEAEEDNRRATEKAAKAAEKAAKAAEKAAKAAEKAAKAAETAAEEAETLKKYNATRNGQGNQGNTDNGQTKETRKKKEKKTELSADDVKKLNQALRDKQALDKQVKDLSKFAADTKTKLDEAQAALAQVSPVMQDVSRLEADMTKAVQNRDADTAATLRTQINDQYLEATLKEPFLGMWKDGQRLNNITVKPSFQTFLERMLMASDLERVRRYLFEGYAIIKEFPEEMLADDPADQPVLDAVQDQINAQDSPHEEDTEVSTDDEVSADDEPPVTDKPLGQGWEVVKAHWNGAKEGVRLRDDKLYRITTVSGQASFRLERNTKPPILVGQYNTMAEAMKVAGTYWVHKDGREIVEALSLASEPSYRVIHSVSGVN